MSDLNEHARALLKLLREHPEMLDDELYRDDLQALALLIRDALDDHNSNNLRSVLDGLEGA